MTEPTENLLPRTANPAAVATPAAASPATAGRSPSDELLREAEAQHALAALFPQLKLDALRAVQELFPLHARAPQGAPATPPDALSPAPRSALRPR